MSIETANADLDIYTVKAKYHVEGLVGLTHREADFLLTYYSSREIEQLKAEEESTAAPEEGDFKIESGVPISPIYRSGRGPRYPFADLQIGDSFFAKGCKPGTVGNAARSFGEPRGMEFVIRRVIGGTRVWRMK
ncbi:hypothetical protein SAMN05444156_2170 [Verrucomicrobium sp. GAS474]|uniref:DUF7303 family protein n=1 Tax=Verrucomicrobium sp. GAS474 TaxID=1882831 RepID=UPI00087D6D0B|nr:hypothetical protein [Verrucomicrobium sp. GAS474]SDU13558.1 hypothetical protein SAMN05444156_2170 [Verrucomicrobium sp. GAS474]